MAAPTQVFPPWLTAVPTTLFDGNGAPTATETTVLFLPLTYYGPSIPLGPDWTYGGLSSPATTSTILPVTTATELSVTTSSKVPPTTITAIPTSLPITLYSSTSSATPTTFPASSLPLSNSVMTTLSATPTSASAAPHTLSRGGLIGVVLGSILGFIFLFIAAILLYLCMKGRRRQEDPEMLPPMNEPTRTQHLTPFTQPWASYSNTTHHIIGWNDRSPRTSGGEADPFLAQTTDELPQSPGIPQHSNVPPYVGIARVPVPTTGSQSSKGTSKSSGTNHSGYGVLVDRPTLNLLPGTTAELERQRRGHILTTEELDRINEEAVLPQDSEGELSPLHSPYRLDPNEGWTSGNRHSPSSYPSLLPFMKPPSQNSLAAYPDADEAATLLTARRVRVEELASRSPPRLTGSFGEAYSKNGNRGLLSSLGLDRLSWFKNSDSGSRRSSRANGYSVSPLADEDPEIGQALLSPELPAPRLGLGLFAGDRPISTASGRSGNTVYHDAQSSPATPVSVSTPITPLPRVLTPSGSSGPQSSRPVNSSPIPPVPPIPDLSNTSHSNSSGIPNMNHGLQGGVDVLDLPAPTAVSPLMSSIRTSNSNFSARETMTDVTDELKVHPFPPGLPAALQRSWTDGGSSITHVTSLTSPVSTPVNVHVTSSSILSSQDTSAGISIDILEEAPPIAGEGWRNLAAEQGILARRTTFGIPISSPDIMSEQGSIYSVNSHVGPTHTRSTGSDPASARRDLSGSVSSASSRPSVFSAVRTHSSGRSLAHSESVSSDARRRASPVTTSFSPRSRPRSPQPPLPSPLLNVPPTVHYPPERAGTHRMTGSQDMDAERNGSSSPEPMSPVSQMSSAPWAGGLGDNWTPAP